VTIIDSPPDTRSMTSPPWFRSSLIVTLRTAAGVYHM
jgi:hypothetical protein